MEDDKDMGVDVAEMHRFLVNLPDTEYFLEDRNEKGLEYVVQFICNYAVHCYGWRDIQRQCRSKPGISPLTIVTTSDIAFCLTVIENSMAYWEFWYNKKGAFQMDAGELEKYKKKNQAKMTSEERSRYTVPAKKFTNLRETKKTFGRDGWSKEGKNYYQTQLITWKTFASNKDVQTRLEIKFEDYVRENDVCKYWKEKGSRFSEGGDEEAFDDGDDDPDFTVSFSCSPLKKSDIEDNEEEDDGE